jgi:hypothetical protein
MRDARLDIMDVLARYVAGIDRRDMAMVASCYFPDATEDRGRFRGPLDAFLPWLEAQLRALDACWHQLGLPLIEIDGDRADVQTTCLARHRIGAAERSIALRYVDRFERRDGRWRIARRVVVYEPRG